MVDIPPRLVFCGPLPPPVNGMSQVNISIIKDLQSCAHVFIINTQPNLKKKRVLYYTKRIFIFIFAFFRLIVSRIKGAGVFYASVSSGWALVMEALVALAARLMGMRVFLHHHAYSYLDHYSWMMRIAVAFAGRSAVHIMLSERMAQDFASVYSFSGSFFIAPNGIEAPPASSAAMPSRPLTVGMLSNLTLDKGTGRFISVLQTIRSKGLNVRGVLAGPIEDEETLLCVSQSLKREGSGLEWRGPVYGPEKEIFFQDIDVFLFPSSYPNEAYPLVLLEALTRGAPFIAWGRGCIGSFENCAGAFIIDPDNDFVAAALPIVARLYDASDELQDLKTLARHSGARINHENALARRRLLQCLVASADAVKRPSL